MWRTSSKNSHNRPDLSFLELLGERTNSSKRRPLCSAETKDKYSCQLFQVSLNTTLDYSYVFADCMSVCLMQGRDGLPGREGPRGPEGRPGLPGTVDNTGRLKGEKGERVSASPVRPNQTFSETLLGQD